MHACTYNMRMHAGHTIIIDQQPVRDGSRDMLTEAAMTHAECQEAIAMGRAAALSAAQDGVRVLCVGEIGIGNTTAAAALLSALTGAPPTRGGSPTMVPVMLEVVVFVGGVAEKACLWSLVSFVCRLDLMSFRV